MKRFSIPADAKPYTDALKELIRHGVWLSPLLEKSPLVDLPVVQAKVAATGNTDRVRAFAEILEDVVTNRLEGKSRNSAAILFALGEHSGVSMSDRYRQVAKLNNTHWTWENYRKEPLDRLLLEVYLALYREAQVANPGTHQAERSEPQRSLITGGQYKLCFRETTYNFPSQPGDPRAIIDVREIEALEDGVDTWRQSFYHWGKSPDQTPKVALFGPGTLFVTHETALQDAPAAGRGYVTEVRLPTTLREGERFRFTILREHDVPFEELVREGWHDGWSFKPVIPTDTFILNVRFPDKRKPRTIWHYADLPVRLAPGVPTPANTVEADNSGFISWRWDRPMVGYAYGLEWEW